MKMLSWTKLQGIGISGIGVCEKTVMGDVDGDAEEFVAAEEGYRLDDNSSTVKSESEVGRILTRQFPR